MRVDRSWPSVLEVMTESLWRIWVCEAVMVEMALVSE